jgi:hypothetical protein
MGAQLRGVPLLRNDGNGLPRKDAELYRAAALMADWNEITATTLYTRSQRLAILVQKTNALFEQLQGAQQLRYDEDRKKRNQRRAQNRWRAREARRLAEAPALASSTSALAAASRGLPKPGAPEDLIVAIRESARLR